MFGHTRTVTRADRAWLADELAEIDRAIGVTERACCCPARPVVRAIMPPTPERRHSVDLLLCGHHYRVSRPALAAAGASIVTLSGSEDAAAALLDVGTGTRPASDAHRRRRVTILA